MKYIINLFALITLISFTNTAYAQLTVDVGPDLVLTCLQSSITLNPDVTGETDPANLTYLWTGPNGFTTNDMSVEVAWEGIYTVEVTDTGNGSTATDEVLITLDIDPPLVTANIIEPSCSNPGSIDLTSPGAVEYIWSNGIVGPSLSDLLPGTYCVTVVGDNGCTTEECYTLVEASEILITADITDPDCVSAGGGSIDLFVTGGTPPYLYEWNNGATTEDLTNLEAGLYVVTVTDAVGCIELFTVELTEPPQISLQISAPCDNSINVQAIGGSPPFSYEWLGPNGYMSNVQNPQDLVPGLYIVTVIDVLGCTLSQTVQISPSTDPCTKIYGRVVFDDNMDCIADPAEDGMKNLVVRAEDGMNTFYAMTDSTGNYTLYVVPGSYTVEALINNPQATICPATPTASVPAQGDSTEIDFTVSGIDPDCPKLKVEINASFLRRCFDNSYYWVSYSNLSPADATDAYIDVTLDPFLSFVSSALPHEDLGSNTYRFQLGTVEGNASGNFWIRVEVSCDAVIGQTHCTEAHIYPDSLCNPSNPLWTGAELQLRSECAGDSLHFILKNVGTAGMSNNLEYVIIEDGLMFNQGFDSPLPAGDSMIISLEATGSTWRLEAEQEPFLPTLSIPVLTVEGCIDIGSFSTGYVTQFTVNDAADYVDIDCQENVASFDPNDKNGFPTGYGPSHYIDPGTALTYKIRFQNTGTDTAFNVVILDTLSQWFDPTTIEIGTSSHPYRFELKGAGILEFAFDNIMLPDSNVNEPLSHGFVTFKLAPRENTPLETDLENSAAIYFDFNEPIFTNATQHRIGVDYITVGSWHSPNPEYKLSVSPNPMSEQSVISLKGVPVLQSYTLRVFDSLGRLVHTMQSAQPVFTVQRTDLMQGQYFFKVEELGVSGKLIVK